MNENDERDSPGTSEGGSALDERRRLELEQDRLVELMGRFLERRPDSLLLADERFLRWWGDELRDRLTPGERAQAQQSAARFARDVLGRLDVAALAVRESSAWPVERTPPAEGTVSAVLAECARHRLAPWLEVPVAAGVGREMWDEPCERCVEVPPALGDAEHIALTVVGDSMTPLLHAGDVVLARVGGEPRPRSVVVARRPDDGYVVKAVGRIDGQSIELRSLNPAFPPILVPRGDRVLVGTVVMRWCPHPATPM